LITPFHERAHMPRIDASPKDRHQPDAARGEVVFLSVLDLRRDWLRTEVLRAALRLCGRARWRLIRTIRDLVSSTSAPAEIVDYEVNCALAMLERCPSGARSSPRRGIESEAHLDHACFRVIARVRHATEIDLTSLRQSLFCRIQAAGGPESAAPYRRGWGRQEAHRYSGRASGGDRRSSCRTNVIRLLDLAAGTLGSSGACSNRQQRPAPVGVGTGRNPQAIDCLSRGYSVAIEARTQKSPAKAGLYNLLIFGGILAAGAGFELATFRL